MAAEAQRAAGAEVGDVRQHHLQPRSEAQHEVVEAEPGEIGNRLLQGGTGARLDIRTEQHQRLAEIPPALQQLIHAGGLHRRAGFGLACRSLIRPGRGGRLGAAQLARLGIDRAVADRQVAAEPGGHQAAGQGQPTRRHGGDPRLGEGHVLEAQRQGRLVAEAVDQAQPPLALDAAALADPRPQILNQQLLEIEQHRGLHLLQRLADNLVLASAEAQEAVGHRISEAAAHQQLKVDTALAPDHRPSGQIGEEAQAVTPAGQAQFELVTAPVQGDGAGQIDTAGGPGGAQGQVHTQAFGHQFDMAAIELEGLLAEAGVVQGQIQRQFGLTGAEAIAPTQAEVAAQAFRHWRQQGQQRERDTRELEAAGAGKQGALQPHLEGIVGQGQIPVPQGQPQMATGLELGPGAAQIGTTDRQIGIQPHLQPGEALSSRGSAALLIPGIEPLLHLLQHQQLLLDRSTQGFDRCHPPQRRRPLMAGQRRAAPHGPGLEHLVEQQ